MPYANKWNKTVSELKLEPEELAEWFKSRGGWRKDHGTFRLSTPWKEEKELKAILKLFKKKFDFSLTKRPKDVYVVQTSKTRNARLFFSKAGTEKLVEVLKPFFKGEPSEWFDES